MLALCQVVSGMMFYIRSMEATSVRPGMDENFDQRMGLIPAQNREESG